MWLQPLFFSTQNLHFGHCLNFLPLANFKNALSASLYVELIWYYLQVISLCHSDLQFKQYSFLQSKHTKCTSSSFSKKNIYSQFAVGHHEIDYPWLYAYDFNVCFSYFSYSFASKINFISLSFVSALHLSSGHFKGNLFSDISALKYSVKQFLWKIWPQTYKMANY